MTRSPGMGAQDRLAFLLSFVPFLLERERIGVPDAAEHFGVDPEFVREQVRLIAVSGVPGETRQYLDGDLFDIDWGAFEDDDEVVITHPIALDDTPRFSAREAAALIAGLQYLQALPENANRDAIGTLMAKLTRGSSSRPLEVAVAPSSGGAALAVLGEAVGSGLQVEFDYVDGRGGHVRRRVDPLRLESVDTDWYLRGWCHLRGAIRTFRVDRMTSLVPTDLPIEHRTEELAMPERLFEGSPDDLVVDVELPRTAVALIADYLPDRVPLADRGDRVATALRASHPTSIARLAASLAGILTVIGPPEVRAAVADRAADALARYDAHL